MKNNILKSIKKIELDYIKVENNRPLYFKGYVNYTTYDSCSANGMNGKEFLGDFKTDIELITAIKNHITDNEMEFCKSNKRWEERMYAYGHQFEVIEIGISEVDKEIKELEDRIHFLNNLKQ